LSRISTDYNLERHAPPPVYGDKIIVFADWIIYYKKKTLPRNAGFLSNEFPNCPPETIKARAFLAAKFLFVIFQTF
jgi:hypothetical protein